MFKIRTLSDLEFRAGDRFDSALKQQWQEEQKRVAGGGSIEAEPTPHERALEALIADLDALVSDVRREIRKSGRKAAPTAELHEEWRRLTDLQRVRWMGIELPQWMYR